MQSPRRVHYETDHYETDHYETETVIASSKCTTLKHMNPAKCVQNVLLLSRDLQPITCL